MAQDLVCRLQMDDAGFSSGIAGATSNIQKLDKQATLAKRGLDNFFRGSNADLLKNSFAGVDQVMKNLERTMSSSSSNIKKQFRALQTAAIELENEYRNLSKAEQQSGAGQALRSHIDELIVKAGSLKDTMIDMQGAIKFASSDTAGLDALAQGITTLSATAQVAAGAVSIFGVSEEKVAQVQKSLVAIMAVTNGLKTIQNALQKESNLMQFIAIVREKGLLVTLGLRTAATVAATTAEGAETAAVEANTAAWAMNPIGAIAVAILATVAAIVALVKVLTQASDEEKQLAAAGEEYDRQLDAQSSKLGEQIYTFKNLQKQYNECGGDINKLSKFVKDNKEEFNKLGITVNTVDRANALFANNTNGYIQAAIARTKVAAAEVAMQEMLGKTISEVTKMYGALARGEEVNWSDMKDQLKTIFSDADAEKIMKEAGLTKGGEWFFDKADIHIDPKQLVKSWSTIQDAISNNFRDAPVGKMFQGIIDEGNKAISQGIEGKTWKQLWEENETGANNVSSGLKKTGKSAAGANNEIKKVLSTIEGCDAIIEEAEKGMKKLDKNSSDYAEKMKNFLTVIQGANIAKFALIDQSSLKGLKEARTVCENILSILPENSEETQYWIEIWKKLNGEITVSEQKIKDLKEGIQEGSETQIKRRRSEIAAELSKLDPNKEGNLELIARLKLEDSDLQFQLNDIRKKLDSPLDIIRDLPKLDFDKSYKQSNLEKLQSQYDKAKESLQDLVDKQKEATSAAEWNELSQKISDTKAEIISLGKAINAQEITDDIKNYKEELNGLYEDGIKGGISGLRSLYDAFSKLSDPMEGAENAFEGFLNVMDSLVSIFDTVKGIIDIIQSIATVTKALTGATTALGIAKGTTNALSEKETEQSIKLAAAKATEAAAQGAIIATAPSLNAAITSQGIAAGTAAPSIQELVGTLIELAAAEMFSANAYIPIVGAAIAAAEVAIMTATMAIVKGFAAGSGAFANGGIVGGGIVPGNSLHGDQVYARLNSGELVLNKKQQANLFRLLDSGQGLGNGVGNVEFKIKGQELVGVIKNYNNKKNKLR